MLKKKSGESRYNDGSIYWIILAVMAFISPILFLQLPLNVDESVYLYAGKEMWNATIYRDIFVNKPIGIFLLSALAQKVGGFMIARVLIYAINFISAIFVYKIGSRISNKKVGLIAGIIFLFGVYLFQGYYFITEPVVACLITASIYYLLLERYSLVGMLSGIAILFNDSIAIFLVALCIYFALRYIYAKQKRILLFFAGFSIPLGALFLVLTYYNLLENYIYCTITLVTQWEHPFEYWVLIETLIFLPVWIICFYSYRKIAHDIAERNIAMVFLKAYLILGILYMAITYGGKHTIFFLPAIAVLAATETKKEWVNKLIAILFVTFLAVSSFALYFYRDGVEGQREDVKMVDTYVDGAIYTIPFRLYIPYLSNDSILGVRWTTQVYSEEIAELVIDDLESQLVRYVVVEKSWEELYRQGEHFYKGIGTVYQYTIDHYSLYAETEKFTIYKKKF